ncbi:MAG: HD domain-containing protein [Nitrososphaerota archaeon]|jgi:hypothetical protein|nr:HD domain-containing protein [Nitrososphaerota archaeon]
MKPIVDHHHYKVDLIDPFDRVAIYERYVVDMLLQSSLDDNQRESSIAFELKHHHSTAHLARILARQRNLPIDVCTVGALLHDIYVVKYGHYKDHAHKSADLALTILEELGSFSDEEKKQIISIVYNHSDKEIWSENSFEEFGKDVDTLDSFLYPNAFGYYLKHKKLYVFYNYVLRAKRIWAELNIPQPADFGIFDNFKEPWLDYKVELPLDEAKLFLELVCKLSSNKSTYRIIPPTILFRTNNATTSLYVNSNSYKKFKEATSEGKKKKKDLNLQEVEKMVDIAKQAYVLMWCAIDAYEIITEETGFNRLVELGVMA